MGHPARKLKSHDKGEASYAKILKIDGRHPFKDDAPFSYVEYQMRRRHGGKVRYFNFDLAKTMGLVPSDHRDRLTSGLEDALLESFAGIIINEYDFLHGKTFGPDDVKDHTYMATRYLQLQHPGRTGLASGDGRSIWNGVVHHQGKTWDVTSRGTGATCLSPATATCGRFFKSGDPEVAYGCGFSRINEGVGDAIFSEIFHRNHVATERILCVIEFPGNLEVTVRAGLNLLRPSHFFVHLKQGQRARLEAVADYYIDRQLANRTWAPVPKGVDRYDYLLEQVTKSFARVAAQFEAEYIFCWLDWDGDNVMVDGGIIDYGSIRQFGLFHDEYRFDDDARWSTNVKEQRLKARHIVQTFAQAVDFLKTGRKKPLSRFKDARALQSFDRLFRQAKRGFLLRRLGYTDADVRHLTETNRKSLARFEKVFYRLEATKSQRGRIKASDGITWDAIFSMRDVLRELPGHWLKFGRPVEPEAFIAMARSSFAGKKDLRLTPRRRRQVEKLQAAYMSMVRCVGLGTGRSVEAVLATLTERSAVINRHERVTGDAIAAAEELMVRHRKRVGSGSLQRLIEAFVREQVLDPDQKPTARPPLDQLEAKLLGKLIGLVGEYREGL